MSRTYKHGSTFKGNYRGRDRRSEKSYKKVANKKNRHLNKQNLNSQKEDYDESNFQSMRRKFDNYDWDIW